MKSVLDDYKKEITDAVKAAKKNLKKKRPSVKAAKCFVLRLEEKIKEVDSGASVDIPPSHIDADIAVSGIKKENLDRIVETLEKFPEVDRVEPTSVFANIWLEKGKVYSSSLSAVSELKEEYGASDLNTSKIAILEYSSPNITKPIGVGHLRSTIIGESLARIYEATGFGIIRDNYLGDWGTQFGRVIYGYQKWADKTAVEADPLRTLKDVYVKFEHQLEKTPNIQEEARDIFKRLEEAALKEGEPRQDGREDEELLELWKHFRDLSINAYKNLYKRLDIVFDVFSGEGFFVDKSDSVMEKCLQSKLCKADPESEAIIIDSIEGVPSFLLRKSDGTTLYLTREVAMMKFRAETYKPDVILIVTGEEQVLHFRQVHEVAEHLGYMNKSKFEHIDFGTVLVDGKRMSTRRGTVIELEDLMKQSVEKSHAILKEKNPDLKEEEIKNISEIVGIGAVIYNDLRQARRTNISFDWDKMLNFETGSAAYLQYTAVRIGSIIRKVGGKSASWRTENLDPIFEDESEFTLAKKLLFFPSVISRAQELNSPHLIATYLEELAQLFNSFYNSVSIIKTGDEKLQQSRLLLIQSVAQVLKNGLTLLNVKIPGRM